MESKFFQNAVFIGLSANAIKLGTILTLGQFWVRPSGCHIIYRGQDGAMNYNDIQAVMNIADEDVFINAQTLPPNTIWHYIRRQCSDCGLESPDSPPCIVVINADGDMISNTPNTPVNLIIEQLAGGKLRLRWRYFETGQEVIPTSFKIFMDSGDGFDFDSPIATVPYRRAVEHSWTSDTLIHGQRYKFIVQSYAANAGQSNNTNFVFAIADAVGPPAANGLTINWEEI